MAAPAHSRIKDLQAATIRLESVNLPSNVTVPSAQVDGLPALIAGSKVVFLRADSQVFQISKAGVVSPATIKLTPTLRNVVGAAVWQVLSGTATLTDGAGADAGKKLIDPAAMTTDTVTIKVTVTEGTEPFHDTITLIKVREGSDTINALLSNESHTLSADRDGNILSLSGAGTVMKVLVGAADTSASWAFSRVDGPATTSSISGATVTVTGLTADTGYVDITAARTGYASITKRFTLSKSKQGTQGVQGAAGVDGAQSIVKPIWHSDWTGGSVVSVSERDAANLPIVAQVRHSGVGQVDVEPTGAALFPLDRTRYYRTRFSARAGAGTNGTLYHCLREFISSGQPHPTNTGHLNYKPAAVAAHTDWIEYDKIYGPGDWNIDTAFIKPKFLLNYTGTAGWWEVRDYSFSDVTDAVRAKIAADAAQVDATAAKDRLATISRDDRLDRSEKPSVILEWKKIDSERVAIINQATDVGVAQAFIDAYQIAWNALSNYLVTIAYSNLTTDSVIVRTDFDNTFKTLYDCRQQLLNKTTARASVLATGVSLSSTGALLGGAGGQITSVPTIDLGNGTHFGARNRNDGPVDYPVGTMRQFKQANVLLSNNGVGPVTTEVYGTLDTVKQYPDSTGGGVYQYFYAGFGTFRRWAPNPASASGQAAWHPWVQDLDRNVYVGALDATYGAPAGSTIDGVFAETVRSNAANGAANGALAVARLATISDDGKLDRSEKPEVILKWNSINSEFTALYTKADELGVSRTAYATAYDNLNYYLGVTISQWNVTTVDSVINRADFNSYFATYYGERTKLQAAITAKAATTANTDGSIRTPIGATYSYGGGQIVGTIKIRLPQSWTSTMMRFTVDLFEYVSGKTCTLDIAGYNYEGGTWVAVSARVVGGSNVEYPVRFGHDGTRCCIWIGDTNTPWSYPKVQVRDFFAGHSNIAKAQWETGWSVEIDTGGVLNKTAEVLDTYPAADWSKIPNKNGRPENGATKGADASNLNVAVGRNLLSNSAPGSKTGYDVDWPNAASYPLEGGGVVYADLVNGNGYNIYAPNRACVYVHATGTPPANTFMNFWFNKPNERKIHVKALTRYEAGVNLSTHRCTSWVQIVWYNADKAQIGVNNGNQVTYGGTFGTVPFPRSTVFATAPSGAVYASILVQQYHVAAEADPFTFASQWYFGEALAAQTVPTTWNEGGASSVRDIGYSGDLNASYGAPAGSKVGNTAAEVVEANANAALPKNSGPVVTIANGMMTGTGTANVERDIGSRTAVVTGNFTAPVTHSWFVASAESANGLPFSLSISPNGSICKVIGKAGNDAILATITDIVTDANGLIGTNSFGVNASFGSGAA